jgi:hypothetical protein
MASSGYPLVVGGPRPSQNWFEKNRKWVIPTLIVLAILVACGFLFTVFFFVNSTFTNSFPYKAALERVRGSAEVSERIGKPFRIGGVSAGSHISYYGADGDAVLRIPIYGPKGSGTIVVVGKKNGNRWTFDTFQVDVDGQDQPIPLLEPRAPAVRSAPANST